MVRRDLINKNFWKNKKILITGHTGFKGVWLTLILKFIGVKKIYGLSLNQNKYSFFNKKLFNTIIKSYFIDINNFKKLDSTVKKIKPNIVFNFAAQSLVSEGYKFPLKTYNTNIVGSINLLLSLKKNCPRSTLVMATTDKVYDINNKKNSFVETDILGGNDPYSASKASLEILIKKYLHSEKSIKKFGIVCCRAGNVIGGGDFSINRLLPDIIRSNFKKKKLNIRFRNAIRPWQHVFDPLYEYLLFAQLVFKSKKYSGCYNFGPINKNHVKVSEIVSIIKKRYNNLKVKYVKNSFKETRNLRLNTNKVDNILKRKNKKLSINQALKITLDWYDNYESKKTDIIKFSFKQIEFYFKNKLSFRQN